MQVGEPCCHDLLFMDKFYCPSLFFVPFRFLHEVQSHSNENKMSVQNLATVFGPNILRPKVEDPVTIMEGVCLPGGGGGQSLSIQKKNESGYHEGHVINFLSAPDPCCSSVSVCMSAIYVCQSTLAPPAGTSLVQQLMTVLISEHERLYSGGEPEEPAAPRPEVGPQGPRGTVGWISDGGPQGVRAEDGSSSLGLEDLGSSGTSLDVNISTPAAGSTLRAANQGRGLDMDVSPSKQAKSLPVWKSSFRGPGAKPQPGKLGGSAGDVSGLSGGSWLMSGLSSLRGHRRTSSGEPARDSGSSQRLSTYDNVTASSLSVPSGAGTAWTTSSCDVSVPDSSELSENSGKGEWPAPRGRPLEADGGDAPERCAGGAVGSGAHTDNQAKALSSLVEELQEELRKQKLTYETRIKR